MEINDFEKMQRNLNKMKDNLNILNNENYHSSNSKRKKRQAVHKRNNLIKHISLMEIAREEKMIFMATVVIIIITIFFSTSIFANSISNNMIEKKEEVENNEEQIETDLTQEESEVFIINEVDKDEQVEKEVSENENIKEKIENEDLKIESNKNQIQLEDILLENVSVLKSKEYAEEVRPVKYDKEYNDNPNLPEGVEVITEEGVEGLEQITVIKSFENNELVSEDIINATPIEQPIPEKADVGTSKFLAKNKVYLEDTMYVIKEVSLKSNMNSDSEEICTIPENLDIILMGLSQKEKWCKVEYEGLEGYVQSKYLTSSKVTPDIIEKNRIQKIKLSLNEGIMLNESTSLTYDDYKRMLSGIPADRNHIIEENAEVFYNMDKKYNINGVFLAAIAIHESGWGTSKIASDKKNLFGYGAYDSSPYESSNLFDGYADGIETVAKALVKYYINEEGTPIYDDEVAKASYYNGSTIEDVNQRYASDKEWHNKVYKYMEFLYNRL